MRESEFASLRETGRLPVPSAAARALIAVPCDRSSFARVAEVLGESAELAEFCKHWVRASAGDPLLEVSRGSVVPALGVPAVQALAVMHSLMAQVPARDQDYVHELWQRSVARGVAAQGLASGTGLGQGSQAFAAGLLADLGVLGYLRLDAPAHRELREMHAAGTDLEAAEEEWFGVGRQELSAHLLSEWGAADSLSGALNGSGANGTCRVAELLPAAEAMAEALLTGNATARPRLLGELAALPVIDDDRLDAWWNERRQEWSAFWKQVESRARTAARAPAEAPSAESATEELDVLIVSGSEPFRSDWREGLVEAGYQVREAADPDAALNQVNQRTPDVVLAPLHLPGMTGAELCQALRLARRAPAPYFLLVDPGATDREIEQALQSGADDCLLGDCSGALLLARVATAARLRQLERKCEEDCITIETLANRLASVSRQLQEAELIDPLTGIPNRRSAMEELRRRWSEMERSRRSLCVVTLDLDSFKAVNETYGHEVGDIVLRETAAALQRSLRQEDLVCRISGEQFLVILPGTALDGALPCCERLRACIEANQIEHAQYRGRVTASLGLAQATAGMTHPDQLVRAAEEALGVAKESGRNKVCIAESRRAAV